MCIVIQLHGKHDSVLDENERLKQNEIKLLEGLNTMDQKYKELEEKCRRKLEDMEGKTQEGIVNQQKYKEFKFEIDKIIKTLDIDASVSLIITFAITYMRIPVYTLYYMHTS